jgi:hypothetical protein
MAKCGDKSIDLTVKSVSAKGATKDLAELAVALKLIGYAHDKKKFTCDGECPNKGDCEAVVDFKGELHFRPCAIKNKGQKGHTMGWKCFFKGKATINCECDDEDIEIDD